MNVDKRGGVGPTIVERQPTPPSQLAHQLAAATASSGVTNVNVL